MTLHPRVDQAKLRRILETTRLIEGDYELGILLRHVVTEACSLTGARYGALGVLNDTGDALAEFITVGLTAAEEERIGPRPLGLGLLGALIDHPVPLMVDDLAVHPDRAGFPRNHPPMTSMVGVPIKVRGEVYGHLYLTDKFGGRPFDEEDMDLAEALALAAGIAIENARLHTALGLVAALHDDSRKDHLTGLANRRSWDERLGDELERSRRSGRPVSVALLDLDDFKAVNDRGGHQAGDALLQEFARSWQRIMRTAGDFVARLGGDEFGLLAPGSTSGGVRNIARRHASTDPRGPSYSLGVATWDGSESAGQLVHRADLSMYRSKSRNIRIPIGCHDLSTS
jgi:diguanylate cyclase (GGDEF)-like protein